MYRESQRERAPESRAARLAGPWIKQPAAPAQRPERTLPRFRMPSRSRRLDIAAPPSTPRIAPPFLFPLQRTIPSFSRIIICLCVSILRVIIFFIHRLLSYHRDARIFFSPSADKTCPFGVENWNLPYARARHGTKHNTGSSRTLTWPDLVQDRLKRNVNCKGARMLCIGPHTALHSCSRARESISVGVLCCPICKGRVQMCAFTFHSPMRMAKVNWFFATPTRPVRHPDMQL